ncbi:MAG: hypothetical protein AAF483_30900 [Planctomycetota bacterium]
MALQIIGQILAIMATLFAMGAPQFSFKDKEKKIKRQHFVVATCLMLFLLVSTLGYREEAIQTKRANQDRKDIQSALNTAERQLADSKKQSSKLQNELKDLRAESRLRDARPTFISSEIVVNKKGTVAATISGDSSTSLRLLVGDEVSWDVKLPWILNPENLDGRNSDPLFVSGEFQKAFTLRLADHEIDLRKRPHGTFFVNKPMHTIELQNENDMKNWRNRDEASDPPELMYYEQPAEVSILVRRQVDRSNNRMEEAAQRLTDTNLREQYVRDQQVGIVEAWFIGENGSKWKIVRFVHEQHVTFIEILTDPQSTDDSTYMIAISFRRPELPNHFATYSLEKEGFKLHSTSNNDAEVDLLPELIPRNSDSVALRAESTSR